MINSWTSYASLFSINHGKKTIKTDFVKNSGRIHDILHSKGGMVLSNSIATHIYYLSRLIRILDHNMVCW